MPSLRMLSSLFVVSILSLSCKQRCDRDLDCGSGSYCDVPKHRCAIDCFSTQDCRMPVECRANPDNCAPKGLFCTASGKCTGKIGDRPVDPDVVHGVEKPTDGWTDAVGEGRTFVMNELELAGMGVGFDLDGDGSVDNVLHQVASTVNPSIRQGLGSGQVLLLIEIAGLDEPYTGDDDSVTLKVYGGLDADSPVDHYNNYELPAGREGRCCEFKVDSRWLTTENETVQATVRAPAYVKNFRLYAPTNFPHYSFDVQFLLTVGNPPYQFITIASSQLAVDLDSDLTHLRAGLLGGGLTANSLAPIRNPFCGSSGITCPSGDPSSSLLDLAAVLAGPSPDVDVDGDGRECLLDTNGDSRIDLCCDGAATICRGNDQVCSEEQVQSDAADPTRCTRSLAMTDGYSMAFSFGAVAARIVGTGTRN